MPLTTDEKLRDAQRWVGDGKHLLTRLNSVIGRLIEGTMEDDVALSPAVKQRLRNWYTNWQTDVMDWWAQRPS